MNTMIELAIIVVLAGVTNTLVGTFLVLRGTSMISFGLAHSILFGIVIAFLLTNSLTSPLLLVGAALSGVLIVSLVEVISSSRYIKYDAALGLIYLSIFALGIILLNRFAQNTTLSLNSVVSGQILFTPFIRSTILGIDLPVIIWILGVLLIVNSGFIVLSYKELVLTSFDPGYAELIGISPTRVNYLLMGLVSLTIVGSYTAIGAVLVIAFMIVPAATASLFSKRLKVILISSLFIAATGGLAGLWLATTLDIAITGTIAVVYGMIFLLSLVVAPRAGIVSQIIRGRRSIQPKPDYIVEHGGT